MTAKSLAAGTWYIYAVIAPTKNYLGYTTRATRFSIAKGVVTVTGSISFGDYTGTLTLSLLDCDSEETVASESIRVSGGKGTYHFQHITRGRYLLCSRWTEGGIENILKDEIEIQ